MEDMEHTVAFLTTTSGILESQLTEAHDKLEDLENRSRRDNLRLRGLSEDIADTELHTNLTDLFSFLLGDPALQPRLDRAHLVSPPGAYRCSNAQGIL